MQQSNFLLGLASAIGIIFIWSGFIVFSRAGVTTGLTAYDISALRYSVAGLLVLPFLCKWWPSHLPLRAKIIMSLTGPGVIYSLLMYLGLTEASAAYAGVFANGSLPIFTTLIALFLTRELPTLQQLIAIAVIVTGAILLGFREMTSGGTDVFTGIVLFLSSSLILSVYFFGVKHWQLKPRQALALINVPNAVVFLPIWYFFLPSGLADADTSTVVFQALFQGIGPGFLAVIMTALAVTHLGSTPTAGFAASVPATAALLAIPVLSEVPTNVEWLGICVVTLGLAILLIRRS